MAFNMSYEAGWSCHGNSAWGLLQSYDGSVQTL